MLVVVLIVIALMRFNLTVDGGRKVNYEGAISSGPRSCIDNRSHRALAIQATEGPGVYKGWELGLAHWLSDNPSRDNGWSGYLIGKNSTQEGDR